MKHQNSKREAADERGIALAMTILLILAVAAMATAAVTIGARQTIVNRVYARQSLLDIAASGGLEVARARLNADPSIYPDSLFAVLEDGVVPTDADGTPLPGVQRWTYVGPTGDTSGQFGVFGTIVSVARDAGGGVSIRRRQLFQESFAKFAYFTDIEPSYISFGGGDQIFGPVHTNSNLKIYSSGATFHDETRTAGIVPTPQYGTFVKGYEENVAPIEMPQTADLDKLLTQGQAGNTAFVSTSNGAADEATMRIEFVNLDLNADGDSTDANEGFIRVYTSTNSKWVTAAVPSNGMRNSQNCGHYHSDGTFIAAADHPNNGPDSWVAALTNVRRRCHLGGSDSIFGGFVPNDGNGSWLTWPGAVSPLVAGRPDANYLFPISRELNPNFKGVIFVQGRVAVSGKLRGRVTVAATDDIILADDVIYARDPGLGTCENILGLFAGDDIIVADNTLNSPKRPTNGQNYKTYDDTSDEFFHAVILALDVFTVGNYAYGSRRDQPCEGAQWGRGCLYLTGGIVQTTRGAVGTIRWVGGTGYVKRYAYDACAATAPPPYFPTTGHFSASTYYQVDPTGFDPAAYFAFLTAG